MRHRIALLMTFGLLAVTWPGSAAQVGPVMLPPSAGVLAAGSAPAEQTVYRLTPRLRTIGDARSRAGLLGVRAASLQQMRQVGTEFLVSDGKWDYSLDTERQLETLMDRDVMTGKAGRSPVIPDMRHCRDIALNFLGSWNLIEGGESESLQYVTTNEVVRSYVSLKERGLPPGPPRVVMREVVFGKTIGGVPVVGPGSRVSVFVGDRGSVIGFMSNWMPVVATQEKIGVAPPDAAYRRLGDRLRELSGKLPDRREAVKEAQAQQTRYALSAFKTTGGEMLLLPVYEFRGSLKDGRDRVLSFSHPVLAASNPKALASRLQLAEQEPVAKPPVVGTAAKPPTPRLPRLPKRILRPRSQ